MTAMTDEQIIDLWSPRLGEGIQRPVLGKNKIIAFGRACIAAERARADALQEKFDCADLMAQCMAGLREDCIEAGVVDESVPPMMYPEEIIPRLARADALEAALLHTLRMEELTDSDKAVIRALLEKKT